MESKETRIPSIEDMKKKALEFSESIPNLREKQKFMTEIRGFTIEFAIIVELCFNQLITETGKDLVFDEEDKALYLIKGIREKKNLPPKLKTKANDMKKLIQKIFVEDGKNTEEVVFNNFDMFLDLRDIFAHVPVNWNSDPLKFYSDKPYKHLFKDEKWKDVLLAHQEFVSIFQWIIDIILFYNRQILFKKEIYSQLLLGKSQAEIEEETKRFLERKNETTNTNK